MTEVLVPWRVAVSTVVATPVAEVLVITKLLVPNMAAGIGVNLRISQNFVQQIETEDVPCQLGLPELVVVQLGHHLAGIAVHVNGNFAVLQSREKMVGRNNINPGAGLTLFFQPPQPSFRWWTNVRTYGLLLDTSL